MSLEPFIKPLRGSFEGGQATEGPCGHDELIGLQRGRWGWDGKPGSVAPKIF